MRRLALAWTCGVACATAALPAQTKHDPAPPEVRSLVLDGVKHVDLHDLEKSLSTHASRCRSLVIEPFCLVSHSPTFEDKHYLDEDEFRRDVLRIRLYYWKRGYREATVDTTVTIDRAHDRSRVTFKVAREPADDRPQDRDRVRLDADQRQDARPADAAPRERSARSRRCSTRCA